MKKIKLVMLNVFCILLIGCKDSQEIINEQNKSVIEGDVSDASATKTNFGLYSNIKRISEVSVYDYDDLSEQFNPSYYLQYEYNENGQVSKEIEEWGIGAINSERDYDENGFITSTFTELYFDNEDGARKLLGSGYQYGESIGNTANLFDELFLDANGVDSLQNIYDNNGNLSETNYLSSGTIVATIKYVYDESVRVRYRNYYFVNNGIENIFWTEECAYNIQNEIIRETRYMNTGYEDSPLLVISYLRDEKSNLINYLETSISSDNMSKLETKPNYYKNYYDEDGYLIASIVTRGDTPYETKLKIYNYETPKIENKEQFFEMNEFDFNVELYKHEIETRINIISEFLMLAGEKIDNYEKNFFPGDFLYSDFDQNGKGELLGYITRTVEQESFLDIYYINEERTQLIETIPVLYNEDIYMNPILIDDKLVCKILYIDTWTFVQSNFYYVESNSVFQLKCKDLNVKSNGITYKDVIVFPFVYDKYSNIYRNWDEIWQVPVRIINGEIREYEYKIVTKKEFENLSNWEEAILEAREAFISKGRLLGVQTDWPIKTKEIKPYEYLITDNNLLFINFHISFTSEDNYMYLENIETGESLLSNELEDTFILGCAEFRIVNNYLYLYNVEFGKRNLGSQENVQEDINIQF